MHNGDDPRSTGLLAKALHVPRDSKSHMGQRVAICRSQMPHAASYIDKVIQIRGQGGQAGERSFAVRE